MAFVDHKYSFYRREKVSLLRERLCLKKRLERQERAMTVNRLALGAVELSIKELECRIAQQQIPCTVSYLNIEYAGGVIYGKDKENES